MSIKSRIAIISCSLILVVSVILAGVTVSVFAATKVEVAGSGTVTYTAPA